MSHMDGRADVGPEPAPTAADNIDLPLSDTPIPGALTLRGKRNSVTAAAGGADALAMRERAGSSASFADSSAASPRPAARTGPITRRVFSVRFLLIVPTLLTLLASNILIWYLGYRSQEENLNRLTDSVKKDLLSQLEFRSADFVDVPIQAARIIAEEYKYGRASAADHGSLRTVMWAVVRNHPFLLSVTLGLESGLAVAYRPDNPDTVNPLWGGQRGYQYFCTLNASSSNPDLGPDPVFPTAPDFVVFNAGQSGAPQGRVLTRIPGYAVTKRLFYTTAAAGKAAAWTPATFASDGTLTVFYSAPLFDPRDAFVGVVGVGTQLDAFGASAREVLASYGAGAGAYLIERTADAFLLWSSVGKILTKVPNPANNATTIDKRLSAATSDSELVRASARELEAALGPLYRIERAIARVINVNGQVYIAQMFPVRHVGGIDWLYVVLLDQTSAAESVRLTMQNSGIITAAICIFALAVSILTSFLIVNPLRALARQMEAIREMRPGASSDGASVAQEESDDEAAAAAEGEPDAEQARGAGAGRAVASEAGPEGGRLQRRRRSVGPVIAEFRDINDAFRAMAKGVRSFEKYVPGDYVRALIKSKLLAKPGLTVHASSIFFCDIQGFTALTESMAPNRLVEVMTEAMEALSQRISVSQGTIDKYIGDAIMAFFSTPIQPLPDHEARACSAAVLCQSVLADLRPGWRQRMLPPLECRIGIDAGNVLIGNFGSSTRLNYTVLGDHVNVAARLEPLNKRYGTSILVSERVLEGQDVRERFLLRTVDRVVLKGRSKVTGVHELLCERKAATPEQLDWARAYEAAFALYAARRFEEAARAFEAAVPKAAAALQSARCSRDRTFADRSASLLAARCRAFAHAPPPDTWDGADVLEGKFD